MAGGHLSTEEFFEKLTTLLQDAQNSGHGSVYLSQKRLTYGTPAPTSTSSPEYGVFPDLDISKPLPIIIRATNGKGKEKRKNGEKVKLSTVVEPEALEGFFTRYADICKTGMQALKKRDRSKRKKGKDKKKGVEKKS